MGADRFFWASDFPHPDHPPDYTKHVAKLIDSLPDSDRAGVLGQNVLRAYNLT